MSPREKPRKACCMVSELLEESGVDREKLRLAKRQILDGVILLCRWQLERMEQTEAPAPTRPRRGQRIVVE